MSGGLIIEICCQHHKIYTRTQNDKTTDIGLMLKHSVADPGFATGGAKVERRRREYRGAEGAEGVRCGEGVSPTHWGRGLGRGSAPSPENVFDFRSKMSTSSAF